MIGGLAVMCRVGSPHRTTVSLDAVAHDLEGLHETIAKLAVTAPGGGQYTFADDFDLDVIDVAPDSSAVLIEQLTAQAEPLDDLELNVVAHTWAFETATALDLVVVEEQRNVELARADGRLVASSAGLVAMKASTIPLRSGSRPGKRALGLLRPGASDDRRWCERGRCRRDARAAPDRRAGPHEPLVL